MTDDLAMSICSEICRSDGLRAREIALRLGKDGKAVDNAVQRIRRKLARNLNPGDISLS